jgi:hypothetical protein
MMDGEPAALAHPSNLSFGGDAAALPQSASLAAARGWLCAEGIGAAHCHGGAALRALRAGEPHAAAV